jgi:hypothetical protein
MLTYDPNHNPTANQGIDFINEADTILIEDYTEGESFDGQLTPADDYSTEPSARQ